MTENPPKKGKAEPESRSKSSGVSFFGPSAQHIGGSDDGTNMADINWDPESITEGSATRSTTRSSDGVYSEEETNMMMIRAL